MKAVFPTKGVILFIEVSGSFANIFNGTRIWHIGRKQESMWRTSHSKSSLRKKDTKSSNCRKEKTLN